MSDADLKAKIESAFEERDTIGADTKGDIRDAVDTILDLMDRGKLRVAEKFDGTWRVNEWLKKAVLLSFRLNNMNMIAGGPGGASWWDKVPSKFAGWGAADFKQAGFRTVPNSVVRHSAYIAPGVILMPCFVTQKSSAGDISIADSARSGGGGFKPWPIASGVCPGAP